MLQNLFVSRSISQIIEIRGTCEKISARYVHPSDFGLLPASDHTVTFSFYDFISFFWSKLLLVLQLAAHRNKFSIHRTNNLRNFFNQDSLGKLDERGIPIIYSYDEKADIFFTESKYNIANKNIIVKVEYFNR